MRNCYSICFSLRVLNLPLLHCHSRPLSLSYCVTIVPRPMVLITRRNKVFSYARAFFVIGPSVGSVYHGGYIIRHGAQSRFGIQFLMVLVHVRA